MRNFRDSRTAALAALLLLWGCGKSNTYVPPPPPRVAVAMPVKQAVTPYLEATGYVAAIQSVDLVARIQGFLQEIDYQDGAGVKGGTVLFRIEPEPYQQKVQEAQAALVAAKANLAQAEPQYRREAALLAHGNAPQASVDQALAARDTAQATIQQDEAELRLAEINLGYTDVKAPFDGVVTAHLVSVGEFVGAGTTPTQLATIVQLNPIYVNFTLSEQDVQRFRAEAAQRGVTTAELRSQLKTVPVEVALQTETGYPHHGTLDYFSPTVDQSTGTHAVRAILDNPDRMLLPGNFVRVRLPVGKPEDELLVPDEALGSDIGGRYLLVVGAGDVVQQRRVETGTLVGSLRVITGGLKPEDRVVVSGLLRAIPGQKVAPELQTAAATPAAQSR
ncbi:MAG TPA: efflux RND transporter periplasmic adaptor subunit [Stellaceae bacterium]|nr:efflux RND transporter periplasmic adaptor subunit [Stellaceae bacterium]